MATATEPLISLTPSEFIAFYWVVVECAELHLTCASAIFEAAQKGKPELIKVVEACMREAAEAKNIRKVRGAVASQRTAKFLKPIASGGE